MVLSVTVLQHIQNEQTFMEAVGEIARVAKTEGKIVLLEEVGRPGG